MKMSKLALVLSSCALSGFAFANQNFNSNLAMELQNELRMASQTHPSTQRNMQHALTGTDEFVQQVYPKQSSEQYLQPSSVSAVPDLEQQVVVNAAMAAKPQFDIAKLAAAQDITINRTVDTRVSTVENDDLMPHSIAKVDHDAQVDLNGHSPLAQTPVEKTQSATAITPKMLTTSIESRTTASNMAQPDRLQELTQALSAGQYQTEVIPLTQAEKQQELNIKLRNQSQAKSQVIEFNNETLNKKYPVAQATFSSQSRSNDSWMEKSPLPKNVGRISSEYGSRVMNGRIEYHPGIDLAAPSGTPIYATGSGIVTKAGWGNGYGQYVEINHGNGYLTRYGHASRVNVQVGDRVQAGDLIANVGCTGRCTGPHLHYEVVKDGERRNPSTYLALLP